MPAPSTGLTRVTVASPQRRVDVALPDAVPLAEMLPDLLQRAGDGLADDGEQHGGWVLRRGHGTPLAVTETLAAAGVRDGEVLHLVAARAAWPEPEYDDVVEAVATRARHLGSPWTGDATRVAAIAAAGLILAVGMLGPLGELLAADRFAALGIATAFLVAGILASRAYGEPLVGAALAAFALPLAALGGRYLLGAPWDAAQLLVAGAALTLWSVAGGLGVVAGLWIFVAGATLGTLASAAALTAFATGDRQAAALVLVAVVIGVTVAPLLAIRLGRLPMPVVTLPPGADDAAALAERPDQGRVLAAVARAGATLTGMLMGLVLAAAGAASVLLGTDPAALALTLVAGVALLLRARLFVTVRQRVPLLAGGLALLALPLASGTWTLGPIGGAILAGMVVAVAAAGARYRRRAPSPYLGRAADILDTLCLVSVIPIAAAILGLYATLRGLSG